MSPRRMAHCMPSNGDWPAPDELLPGTSVYTLAPPLVRAWMMFASHGLTSTTVSPDFMSQPNRDTPCPTRRAQRCPHPLAAGGRRLGNICVGDIRAAVSVAGTPRSFRLLDSPALWLTIGLLIALLFSDTWRALSPLVPMLFYSDSLSGLYAPQCSSPITIRLLTLASTYLAAGALHAPWWGKAVVLGCWRSST